MQRIDRRPVAFLGAQLGLFLHRGSARFLLAAGLGDAALASMAGFGSAIYAARFLDPALLGAYAVYFPAFVLGGFVSANLYLLPSRVAALEMKAADRLGILPRTITRGAFFAGLAALVTPLAGIPALGELSVTDIAPLAITCAAVVLLSPLQDHMRATYHLAGRSPVAVAISGAHLLTLAISVIALHLAPVPRQWVPFGAIALANLTSLALGLWIARDWFRMPSSLPPVRELIKPGWALLLVAIIPVAAQFVASALVASLKAVETVGYAEAARVVATPVHVAALGINQALTPGLMEAGQSGSRSAARRVRRLFILTLVLCSVAYLPIVGIDHVLNPMGHLLPTAYHLHGLVILSALSILVLDLGLIPRAELAGAQRGSDLVLPALVGSLAHVMLVAALLWQFGAYVIPLGILVSNTVTCVMGFRRAERLFVR